MAINIIKEIDNLIAENADDGDTIFALQQVKERVEEYEEALHFFMARFEWGVSEAAAFAYHIAIARFLANPSLTWDDALDFEEEDNA